ncbi:MAG: hypothetical protein QM597_09830 [Aeromicrobium sp.]|uniref:hypothetical protein n=1 Tax=Aeromicrobium sp. TaxID=1871063 RepID=UPI0039E6E6D3
MLTVCLVVIDRSPLADLVDDVVHHLVAAGETVALVGVDSPAEEYSPDFGPAMPLGADDEAGTVVALVNCRTLARLAEDDPDHGIALLRRNLEQHVPTLLAVSDLPDTRLDPAAWAQVAEFLSGTTARWLSVPEGQICAATEATPPPAEFDLDERLYPPFWAEPWSWQEA